MAITEAQLTTQITTIMADGRDATDMGALVTQAIADAFAEGKRFAWEKTFTDLTGDGVTLRYALTGEEIVIAPPEEQFAPAGLTGYFGIETAAWAKDEYGRIIVEQNTNVAGALLTTGTLTGVVSLTTALTSPNIVRLYYYRRPIQPAVTTQYLPLHERYMKPATLGKLHAYLITNGMSGDIDKHEKLAQFWDAKAEKILMEMESQSAPTLYRLRGV